jgi:hypothetical protein
VQIDLTMQIAIIEILLNGNVQHTVTRPVASSEVLILRHIHGHDAIVNPVELSTIKRSNADEIARLKAEYGSLVFAQVYPGAAPQLPETFAAVGIVIEEPETKPAKKAVAAE